MRRRVVGWVGKRESKQLGDEDREIAVDDDGVRGCQERGRGR